MHTTTHTPRATRLWGAATLFALALLTAAMATATLIGTRGGQQEAARLVYDTTWFALLWAAAAASGTVYFVRRRVRRPATALLHIALAVILIGALTTRLTGRHGSVHLRTGKPASQYTLDDGTRHPLPFTLRLERFSVAYGADGTAPADYRSDIIVGCDGRTERATVSMNHIYHAHGARLYQSSYDDDGQGATLSVSEDDWGTGISYTGYALLVAAMLGVLADRRGRFRQLLRQVRAMGGRRAAATALLLCAIATGAGAQRTLPRDVAEQAGRTLIADNGRVCPLSTFAEEFTRKLTGARTYKGLTPCQVLTGVMLFPDDWLHEPFLRIKGRQLRQKLGMEGTAASPEELLSGGYRLGPMLQAAQQGKDKLSEQVLDVDDRLMLLMQVMRLDRMRLFPYPAHGGAQARWYAPTERQPDAMPEAQRQYVRTILPMASVLAQQGRYDLVADAFGRLARYQRQYGAQTVPPEWRLRAEEAYNAFPAADYLYMVNLALALLAAILLGRYRRAAVALGVAMGLSWAALTATLALRWAASGSIPMSNGYETMLTMAWIVEAVALLAARKARVALTFGLTLSGLLLLTAHLAQMDPAITSRMPVLNSPLLALHVSVVMAGYALLALASAASAGYLVALPVARRRGRVARLAGLKPLSELFLYPGVACLAAGIFLGAVWANVSWGRYWGWDPKETWALITLIAYAVPLHQASLPALRRDTTYHAYLIAALACMAVTYFGVNYLMSGMHSYA